MGQNKQRSRNGQCVDYSYVIAIIFLFDFALMLSFHACQGVDTVRHDVFMTNRNLKAAESANAVTETWRQFFKKR